MPRNKSVKIGQIWNVEYARPATLHNNGDRLCYEIIARLVREKKNYWVAVSTAAHPPTAASFALFDDSGREFKPNKGKSRALSEQCLEDCFYKRRSRARPKLAASKARLTDGKISESHDVRARQCRFCKLIAAQVGSNALSFAIRDGNPVTPLHTLIIPRRHVESFFDLNGRERNAIFALLDEMKSNIQDNDETVEGFNVGINDGEAAGQSVFHVHVHLIPRRRGDVENPRGGVRGVIPWKPRY
jgi:diadenosine tetraphosphate (Ap4A) HIT family hydrolase